MKLIFADPLTCIVSSDKDSEDVFLNHGDERAMSLLETQKKTAVLLSDDAYEVMVEHLDSKSIEKMFEQKVQEQQNAKKALPVEYYLED